MHHSRPILTRRENLNLLKDYNHTCLCLPHVSVSANFDQLIISVFCKVQHFSLNDGRDRESVIMFVLIVNPGTTQCRLHIICPVVVARAVLMSTCYELATNKQSGWELGGSLVAEETLNLQ